ncbi:DNA translocase FtsK [Rhizobium sp. SGZ-381]|uniref:DNA translocase FtsK n=1 Tax=Rhizobium sp. SGZ-381 TaxID=3342800 RepID=UPI00366BA311
MHFHRTNFPKSLETMQSDEDFLDGGAHAPERRTPTVDPNEATIEQAPWQAAFKLAPNVRFTRTPESILARPRSRDQMAPVAPEERMPAAAGRLVEPLDVNAQPPVNENATLAPELLVNALQGAASAMQQMPVPPKVKPEPSPRALIFRRQPKEQPKVEMPPEQSIETASPTFAAEISVTPEPQSTASATAPCVPASELPAAPPAVVQASPAVEAPIIVGTSVATVPSEVADPSLPLDAQAKLWLSDFAFFEAGIASDQAPLAAQPVSLAQPSVPTLKRRPAEVVRLSHPLVPTSVTALYREVRPGTRFERRPLSAPAAELPPAPLAVEAPVPAPVIEDTGAAAVETLAAPQESQEAAAASDTVTDAIAVQPQQPVARAVVPMSRRVPQGLPGLSGAMAVRESDDAYEFPPIALLQEPFGQQAEAVQPDALQQSAGLLESILEDFGIRGEIIDVRPGPVVTLYEFEPAPGVKSSRVIGLADDIARSMSALSARVAVVPGRNVIGIELPNAVRETVFLRELIECEDYWETKHRLALCLGKTIGGEPVIAELAKMPHLLVAGTTGSGKSVAINTMILSLLYRLRPEECRLIMIDPKMLELSVYDGIPHLLTPVVTDPKKAVLALKWAVREMEDRYRKMSRLSVRNIDGYNARAAQAREKGETITVNVQTGFDRHNGEIVYEEQELDLSPMPYIVVVVDEMADLMMVAGKEIEGAIQRLAQMARAAGIHLIMATQRPSVDVITGTIKANFPTRISFQVTSKIDSRTILGEQGAEHLLGQGDMLHMAGGGRISRVHGPFVSDAEVEHVVSHLKAQGRPDYLGTVTEDENEAEAEPEADAAVFDRSSMGSEDADDLYEKAVKVVMKDRKCSTSYIQRRLSVGYNRAASLVERMEQEGLVGPANHVGKREIISGKPAVALPDD